VKQATRFYLNDWLTPEKRTALFLGTVILITALATSLVSSTMVITEETLALSVAWIFGFGLLFFNVAYIFLLSVSKPFITPPILKEAYVKRFSRVALVYPIRNEAHGMSAECGSLDFIGLY
jgi:uncharacterized membrane protein